MLNTIVIAYLFSEKRREERRENTKKKKLEAPKLSHLYMVFIAKKVANYCILTIRSQYNIYFTLNTIDFLLWRLIFKVCIMLYNKTLLVLE
jgi:hypothetical protein